MALFDESDVLASTAGAIVSADAAGRIQLMNRAAEALLGWSSADAEGKPLTILMPPRMRARHEAGIHRYVRTHESRLLGKPVRVPAMRRDGSEIDVDLTLRVFRRPDGTELVVGTMVPASASAGTPPGLIEIETKLQKRAYQLI